MKTRSIAAVAILILSPLAHAESYRYDILNRLTRVTYDNGTIVAYTYDPAGNILQKRIETNPDPDGDGISNDVDNCPFDANPGQEDNDLDEMGDACDDDDDNDGLPDADEIAFGSNPFVSDTDGDGYIDGTEVAFGSDPTEATSNPESLVAITGQVELRPGLNLVGTLVNRFFVRSVADWIVDLGGEGLIDSVEMIDRVTLKVRRCGYVGGVLDGSACDIQIYPGRGWFIESAQPQVVAVDTPTDCPPTDLVAGPNLVSFPCLSNATNAFALLNQYAVANDIASIETLDANFAKWQAATTDTIGMPTGTNFPIDHLHSYLLHSRSASQLSISE